MKVHPEDKIEVKPIEDDIYGVRYTFNKGLDPGDYEFKVRSENRKGWSEYFRTSAEGNFFKLTSGACEKRLLFDPKEHSNCF